MLGISVYLQDLDVEYIEKASELGAKYIFTSLHIPEEDFSDIDKKLPILLNSCRNNSMILVPDVSPVTFEKLGLNHGDVQGLKKLGFTSLRLDYGFNDFDEVKNLQTNFELILNASIVDESYIIEAMEKGIDFSKIKVAHNFYPKTNTGLSLDYFNRLNKVFEKYNIDILAFVPGDLLKRFPLYEGLPTIEKHRGENPFVAGVELIAKHGVRDVIIGDSFAKLSTLKKISKYMSLKKMIIPVFLNDEYKDMCGKEFSPRKDMAEKVIRLATPRIENIPILTTADRKKGTITVENKLSGRYSGEIQISKVDLPISATSNIIGYIHPAYVSLLDYVDRDTKLVFEKII